METNSVNITICIGDPSGNMPYIVCASMYFAGDQTAEQAAKQIQSRVQLYLSESQ